ncbi:MAG: protein kinase [Candidatus Aminicenantes bacterium]|nr:protein kinase [Candidatus Aminicenantes bacterium]
MKCLKCQTDNPPDSKYCLKCAALLPLSEETLPPTRTHEPPQERLTRGTTFAGRYEIIEELGKGGMGSVFRVEDKMIEEEVALKLIKPKIAADKKTIKRFSNELKLTRKIAHRNVCKMYDLGEKEGAYFITMEYVPGEDLRSMIRMTKQLSVGTAINIAKQVGEGLAEAHRLGVVHRDLKPSNIIIDKEGNARILDFGIARSLEAKGLTRTGVMIGTPEYMSPEQVEGKEANQSSDIYSLGVILFEMVTGRIPFEGNSALDIALKHKTEIATDPRQFNAQVPEELSQVILKCLEKEREKRYQSSFEMNSELSRIEKSLAKAKRKVPKIKAAVGEVEKLKWKKLLLYGGAAVVLILLIAGGISLFTGRDKAIDSIAVLPLENLSNDPEQEYFADGMTESLISELSKISGLQRVISRTSVMKYKGASKIMPEIAQELNVGVVVEGSVLLVGKRVRITVQLIEAAVDRHLWADSYERDLSNILELQRELARSIAQQIKVVLTPEEVTRLTKLPSINPEAFRLYLKGRFFWNKRTGQDLKKAIEHFEEAIGLDPKYALPYIGLADSYSTLPDYISFPPEEAISKAKDSITKALELDKELGEAHSSLAVILSDSWNWEEAEEEFKRALELNPHYATAHHWYAFYLMRRGRINEAIEKIERAHELDPLSLVINRNLGQFYYYGAHYEKALEALQRAFELDPNFVYIHLHFAWVYLQKSMFEEALTALQKERQLSKTWDPYVEAWVGVAYALMKRRDEARPILNDFLERAKETYIPSYCVAIIYFALGEKDKGFVWLEKGYEKRDKRLSFLQSDPIFTEISTDPRYIALLKKMGLKK